MADATLFDLLEYAAAVVSEPANGPFHSFLHHYELEFDSRSGRREFRRGVNLILKRGGTVFEMNEQMKIIRLGPDDARAALAQLRPATGDAILDGLIEDARAKYGSRVESTRKESIEKLWDAFERLKTLETGANKRRSIEALLDHIPAMNWREEVDAEMKALTGIGNSFQVRHFEIDKAPIPPDTVDYLFTRMSALLTYLLRITNRLDE